MKKSKNNLDEMQEQKLLHIEHTGYWIGFWGLFAAVYFQIAIGNAGIECLGGEIAVLGVMSLYLLAGCLKNGIWDRKLQPNLKTNLIVSLVTGLAAGVFWFVVSYRNYHALAGSIATFSVMFVFVGGAVLALLSLFTGIYKRRKCQLDQQAEDEE